LNVVCGPYIGGIEAELFTFQPYVMWLYFALKNKYDNFTVFSHKKHAFLYNSIDVQFNSVDEKLSDDSLHNGLMNSLITNKEYLSLLKSVHGSVKDVLQCCVKYTKYDNFVIPLSKKLFNRISIDTEIEPELYGKIILINRGADLNVSKKIMQQIDVMEINGSYPFSIDKTLKVIQNAQMVICPCGVWTYFCNLHQVPVVSWGTEGIGMFKDNGPYYFNNKNSLILHTDGKNINPIISGIRNLRGK
jgi:hypothetical protein